MTFVDPGQESTDLKTISAKDLKALKQRAKAAEDAEAKANAAERELSFFKAGVDLSHPMADYFVRGYTGEATPEAVKEEWSRLTGNAGQPSPTDAELAAMQSGQDLASGGMGIPPDKLAERNQKLAGLSPTDRFYDQKFAAIMDEYGSPMGSLAG